MIPSIFSRKNESARTWLRSLNRDYTGELGAGTPTASSVINDSQIPAAISYLRKYRK